MTGILAPKPNNQKDKKMNNSTTGKSITDMTFSKIKADPALYQLYISLIQQIPAFREKFVDPVAGLSVKIRQLDDRKTKTEDHVQMLKDIQQNSEDHYRTMMRESSKMQPLQLAINDNPELNQSFNNIVAQITPQSFLSEENIASLLQKNVGSNDLLAQLQQDQINAVVRYLSVIQSVSQQFIKVIRDLARYIPLKKSFSDNRQKQDYLNSLSSRVILNLTTTFHQSVKKTPTGYHYISLADFLQGGQKQFITNFSIEKINVNVIDSYIREPLSYLYRKLMEFYNSFTGMQDKVIATLDQYQANDQMLAKKIEKLENAIQDYVFQLNRLSIPEVRVYDDRSRMPQKDLGIPKLDPFNKNR